MSLAPASSRGAFLKARLAVNGIQCAARSLGTLTVAVAGLLSSMGASSVQGTDDCGASYQLQPPTGTPVTAIITFSRAAFAGRARRLEIGRGDPEYLTFGIDGVEPQ